MIINKIRTVRIQTPNLISLSPSSNLLSNFGIRKASVVKFRQVTTLCKEPDSEMENKANDPNEKTGDVMSHSFGEGYATRSDEEGFGGIYGGKQSFRKTEDENEDQGIHENHPAYDKSQGSEVKEKEKEREKARHQN